MNPLDLNIDIKNVDTSMPRLLAGQYLCKITEASVAANKAGTGHNLMVIFSTLEEGESNQGKVLAPGQQFRKYYPLQQSENENAPDFRRDLTTLFDAAFKVSDPADRPAITVDNIAALNGEEVVVSVNLKEDPEYGLQNEVRGVKAVG